MILVSRVSLKHMKKTNKELLASAGNESVVLFLPGMAKTFGMITMTVKYQSGKYISLRGLLPDPYVVLYCSME